MISSSTEVIGITTSYGRVDMKTGNRKIDLFIILAAGAITFAWALSLRYLLLDFFTGVFGEGIQAQAGTFGVLTVMVLAILFAGIKIRK